MVRSLALAHDLRLADRHGVVPGGQVLLDLAVEALVLEEKHGIVVADGGLDQALGVVRRGRGRPPSGRACCTNHISGFCEWNGPP